MRKRALTVVGHFVILLGTTGLSLRAQADPGWIGKRVVSKGKDFSLLVNGEVVDRIGQGLAFYRVEQVDGPSLLLRSEVQGTQGWANANQVILASQAIDFFSARIQNSPGDGFLLAARAFLQLDKGEFDKAIGDFTQAIKLEPRTASHFVGRGTAWQSMKSYDRAIADFDEAIRLDPRSPLAFIGRGTTRNLTARFGDATADFSEAIWLDPLAILAYEGRGHAWSARQEFAKAIVDFNLALRLDSRRIDTYCDRGDAWVALKRFDKAIADFGAAIQLDESCARAHAGRASICSTAPDATYRDGKKAVESANRACELTKWSDARLLEVLAAAHAEAGNFKAAVNWQARANALPRDTDEASRGRARLKLYQENKPVRDPDIR